MTTMSDHLDRFRASLKYTITDARYPGYEAHPLMPRAGYNTGYRLEMIHVLEDEGARKCVRVQVVRMSTPDLSYATVHVLDGDWRQVGELPVQTWHATTPDGPLDGDHDAVVDALSAVVDQLAAIAVADRLDTITVAEREGRAAHAEGRMRAPWLSQVIRDLVGDRPVGAGAVEVFNAFTRAYDQAADEEARRAITS